MWVTALLALWQAIHAVARPAPESAGRISYETRDGQGFTVFDHLPTGAQLRLVNNSGICETTPGVNQYSGYLSVGTNMNMFFWFFEARSKPSTAPLAAWFNGGPGCSSMIGLFQENGPCHFVNSTSTQPTLNPYSFNEFANMLYIDQPIGTGFSYGSDPVVSTDTAAIYVWKLLQAFYDLMPQYESRDFGIFTESYGGHYGPGFAKNIVQQNAAIAAKNITGNKINLVALGVNNGWFDATINYKAEIDFAYNNTYKSLITAATYQTLTNTYTTTCVPLIQRCANSGTNSDCATALNTCSSRIENIIGASGDFDAYDIRQRSRDPYPPNNFVTYLQNASVVKAIGAQGRFAQCSDPAGQKFSATGDDSRSYIPALNDLVNGGVPVIIWAGDADWICNWYASKAAAEAVTYPGQTSFANKQLAPYNVNGKQMGTFKTEGLLSFLRVFGAGHEVMYYQPEVSLQVFKQMMQKKTIEST